MALKLIANYSKRLGLPGYSSHQFSVCVETEIHHIDDIGRESARLYQTLQSNVDQEIQCTGFVPRGEYGKKNRRLGSRDLSVNGGWNCTLKQRALILKLIEENHLEWAEIEALTREHFCGKGIRQLYKPEASDLIDLIWERVKRKSTGPQLDLSPAQKGAER